MPPRNDSDQPVSNDGAREGEATQPVQQDLSEALEKVLGYINFSEGTPNSTFLRQLDQIAVSVLADDSDSKKKHATPWLQLENALLSKLTELNKSGNATFADCSQAEAVIGLVFHDFLPAYHEHHRDLLFHLDQKEMYNAFFVARCFESVLAQGAPWSEQQRILDSALETFNDFLGYRPFAVLENGQRMLPYDHEKVRTVPLFVKDAGTAYGRHKEVVDQAITLLKETPDDVLSGAHFNLAKIDELALDVRAYDHDHPVFKRTNYLFGEWDPHQIDNSGFFRRFVVRKIIMDALLDWVDSQTDHAEAVFDAGAVLCGTMLMASSISGDGPACHDSNITLTGLLPIVARQRDEFYNRLMNSVSGTRAKRLHKAAKQTQQPFGHVRQALNLHLAHFGASQVQHRQLANVFARMGHAEAAQEHAAIIPSPGARFECEAQWRITATNHSLERGDVETASRLLAEIVDLLHRAIQCGAIVDPWNILGFQGNFPLFSSREDAIPDQRVEVLLDLMERLFGALSQALTESAAQGKQALVDELSLRFEALANYWDQFAAHVIEDLPKVFGRENLVSAQHVAEALSEWQQAGVAAGDVKFWQKHVDRFTSAKSYACVVQALLAKKDLVAAMALLVQWLSVSEEVGIESGPYSIHALLIEWMNDVTTDEDGELVQPVDWKTMRRLFDFIEANAGDYWDVPVLDIAGTKPTRRSLDEWDIDRGDDWIGDEVENEDDKLFDAAYDGVSYHDSTNDGIDGELMDGADAPGNTEFEIVNRQLEPRIKFIMALAQLWQICATSIATDISNQGGKKSKAIAKLEPDQIDALTAWWRRVRTLQAGLLELMNSIWGHGIDESGGDHDANVEYDIQLQTKFYLLNTIIATHINCRVAEVGLLCLLPSVDPKDEVPDDDIEMGKFYQAVIQRDVAAVGKLLPAQFTRLSRKPLLYVPLDNGGHPTQILVARTIQTDLRFLLKQLPRLGMFRETWHTLRMAHRMERETRPGQMAVTEFDRMFKTGVKHTIDCLILSAQTWDDGRYSDEDLISLIGDLLVHYRDQWYKHSRTMRLSTVEGLRHELIWEEVKRFIETYGDDLFHAKSLTLGNVRTILHNGIEWFIGQLAEFNDPLEPSQLISDLEEREIEVDEAVEMLEIVYGSVVDKFERFLEYNTTTTQSDYGNKFYVLLDFLRVECAYDREAWERIPESIVHRSLAMSDRPNALSILEDILETDSRQDAEKHLTDLQALEDHYGVHLPSISDRLNERFVKPLAVNRMLALVEPAMRQIRDPEDARAKFAQLHREIKTYMEDSAGSAIDIPQWLQDVEREVSRLEAPSDYIKPPELELRTAPVLIDEEEVRKQLETWSQSVLPKKRKRVRKKTHPKPDNDSQA
jgi:hypothetical protein